MTRIFAGRFMPIDLVATSPSGEVWRAWDMKREDLCAIKVLPRDESAQAVAFMLEKREAFNSPYLVPPYGWGGQADSIVIAMPLVSGGSLRSLISQHGPMGEKAAHALVRQSLTGLAHMHASGWLHRRISASTLMFREDLPPMHAVLGGFAAAVPAEDVERHPAKPYELMRGYLAPGVLRGISETTMSDVYSLGVVALVALNGGKALREGAYEPHELDQYLHGVSDGLAQHIRTMLAAKPSDRFPSAVQALAALPREPEGPLVWAHGEHIQIEDQFGDIPEEFDPYAGQIEVAQAAGAAASTAGQEKSPSPAAVHPVPASVTEPLPEPKIVPLPELVTSAQPGSVPQPMPVPKPVSVPQQEPQHPATRQQQEHASAPQTHTKPHGNPPASAGSPQKAAPSKGSYERLTIAGWTAIILGMGIAIVTGTVASILLVSYL